MLIYLADLTHEHRPVHKYVPLGIGYIASYAKKVYGDSIEIILFKSPNKLLDAIDARKPDILGFSNYAWNVNISEYVAKYARDLIEDLVIIQGGPNIRIDQDGIKNFLLNRDYIDGYVMYGGEETFSDVISAVLANRSNKRDSIKNTDITGLAKLVEGDLKFTDRHFENTDLDWIPSPYTSGILDEFMNDGFLPLFETNRGCPYTCTFCVWGISATTKLRTFSMERVKEEFRHAAKNGNKFPYWCIVDANFGLLPRDVKIAEELVEIHEKYESFSKVNMFWSKSGSPNLSKIGEILSHLTPTYFAFQSFSKEVLENVRRANISEDKLISIVESLREMGSPENQTDLLVGLPGDTFASHMDSLNKAFQLGFTRIGGGEVFLIPGSEMETEESRSKFEIQSKFRLLEGGYGLYRGRFIAEVEEIIRGHKDITEDDLLKIRLIRILLFSIFSSGEYKELCEYIRVAGVTVSQFLQKVLTHLQEQEKSAGIVNNITQSAKSECFTNTASLGDFYKNKKNLDNLLDGKQQINLSYEFFVEVVCDVEGRKCLDHAIYKALTELMEEHKTLDKDTIDLAILLARQKNAMYQFQTGKRVKALKFTINAQLARAIFDDASKEASEISLSLNDEEYNTYTDFFDDAERSSNLANISEFVQSMRRSGKLHYKIS